MWAISVVFDLTAQLPTPYTDPGPIKRRARASGKKASSSQG
jgi:hypothetical protein